MTYLLFPGRHLLNTNYQEQYLRSVLQLPLSQLSFLDDDAPAFADPVDHVIFAVTSSNQQHSRYNPIPFHVRAIGVDRFARALERAYQFDYRILGIPHYAPTPRFAEFILKEIALQTEGDLQLDPTNCVVLCSTPGVFSLFRRLGFKILPAEYGERDQRPYTPTGLMQEVVAAGEGWRRAPVVRRHLSAATYDLWTDFPDIPRRVLRLWRDPLLDDSGSLTSSRDYASYAFGMGNREIIDVKYKDIQEAIVPGRIVDEGCADGALLVRIAKDFPDSDLIGIEITGEFMARAHERVRAGQFGGTFVHFHQRNITDTIFEDDSIDTTLCNSTVHELWSYGDGAATVRDYFARKFAQTRPGGRLIIRDVVGPMAKEHEVALRLAHDDGANGDIFAEVADAAARQRHLASLSTYARFLRFAREFRAHERQGAAPAFPYRERIVGGERFVVLALRDAVEFMSKKDYVDNWRSEMHETFAFWDFAEWKTALANAGFHILENPNAPQQGSRIYTNPWILENRWRGKVALFDEVGDTLQPRAWPPTNIVLVGEKPR